MLFVAHELLGVIAQNLAEVSRIDATVLAVPYSFHKVAKGFCQLPLSTLHKYDYWDNFGMELKSDCAPHRVCAAWSAFPAILARRSVFSVFPFVRP